MISGKVTKQHERKIKKKIEGGDLDQTRNKNGGDKTDSE